jgi:hypothetical protein
MYAIRSKIMAAGCFLTLLTAFFTLPTPALAGCAPGIPCIVNKTVPNPNTGPNAPKSNSTSCDADFMNQIYSRAYMEGQRQNLLNEAIIRKPDSVLEYSCFDSYALDAAPIIGRIFSESTRWNNISVPINGDMYGTTFGNVNININMGVRLQTHIQDLVVTATTSYIGSNFGHSFLGGQSSDDFSASETLPCDNMNSVWNEARCDDIGPDDQFWTFQGLISLDPRILPAACTGGTKITQQQIDLSRNENARFQYVEFDQDTPTYKDRLNFTSPCLPPIPTGLTLTFTRKSVSIFGNVTILDRTAYPDMICPNPSCYYNCPGLNNVPPTPCITASSGRCDPV